MVRDPMDDEFPKGHYIGQVVISDPYSNDQILMDPNRIARRYREYNTQQLDYLKNIFRTTRSSLLVLHTNEPFLEKIRPLFRGAG